MYFKGAQFFFLTTGGLINGTFSQIIASNGLAFSVEYFPQLAKIILQQNTIGVPNAFISGNGSVIRSILERADISPTSSFGPIITALNNLDLTGFTEDKLQEALDQLHPGLFGAWSWNHATLGSQIVSTMVNQHFSFCGRNSKAFSCSPTCCPDDKPFAIWFSELGNNILQDKASRLRGFKTLTGGALLGMDGRVYKNLFLGTAAGYTYTDLNWKNHAGKTNMSTYYLGGYGDWNINHFSFDFAILGNFFHSHCKRNIDFPIVDRTAKSKQHWWGVMEHLGVSYLFCYRSVKIYPYASGKYFSLFYSDFKEHGANALDLDVRSHSDHLFRTESGLRIRREFCTAHGVLIPEGTISVIYFSNPSGTKIKSRFAGLPENFTVKTGDHAFVAGAFSFDLGFVGGDMFFFSFGYKGEFANKRIEQELNLNLRWQF
ncbi:MAG: autotransporter outer membrane beta-barrel domain-containing protein [Chlamydiae bacterium]|nr:autotransporter outer membrane beta-barrel domain-containing protein [Chlamydiota bacterium]